MNAREHRPGQADVWDAIARLDRWIEQNGWAGYDPYDIKGTPFFLWLQRAGTLLPLRAARRLVFGLEGRYPLLARRLFGVKKQINAKGMGLFARGYLNLFETTGDEMYRKKALSCLEWLEQNPSKGYSGLCWGYPFDWQNVVFIPKGTPSAVVSSIVGDGFWTAYQVFGDCRYLEICDDICRFFVNDLNIDRLPNGNLCFSYTPLDDFHVHNANLFVGEFLTRVGHALSKQQYVEMGAHAAGYALSEQNPDGSLYYWGRVQDHHNPHHIDAYHSGFEIRALYGMSKWTGEARYQQAVRRYYAFYRNNLLTEHDRAIRPKNTPNSVYPVNIHSCAEAILCSATVADELPEAREVLPGLCRFVVSKMQTEAGWFIYIIRQTRAGEQVIKIPYMRWGQAWMLLSLSASLPRSRGHDE